MSKLPIIYVQRTMPEEPGYLGEDASLELLEQQWGLLASIRESLDLLRNEADRLDAEAKRCWDVWKVRALEMLGGRDDMSEDDLLLHSSAVYYYGPHRFRPERVRVLRSLAREVEEFLDGYEGGPPSKEGQFHAAWLFYRCVAEHAGTYEVVQGPAVFMENDRAIAPPVQIAPLSWHTDIADIASE